MIRELSKGCEQTVDGKYAPVGADSVNTNGLIVKIKSVPPGNSPWCVPANGRVLLLHRSQHPMGLTLRWTRYQLGKILGWSKDHKGESDGYLQYKVILLPTTLI